MANIERKYYQDHILFLIKNKIPHVTTYAGRSYKVKSGIGNYEFINSVFSLRSLGFMQRVQSHILKNETYNTVPKREFRMLKLINMEGRCEFTNSVVEVDLNKAYWRAALKVGAISEELYNEGIEAGLSKVELLASIGAMAKTVRQRSFDGEKYLRSKVILDSWKTKHIWKAVSWEVDKCMQACVKALGKEEYFFYWTDAVFFHNTKKNINTVERIVEEHGFTCKIIKVEYLGKNTLGQMVAWSKHAAGHAKTPLRDERGLYGRVFVWVNNKRTMLQEINELLLKKGKDDGKI